MVGFRSMAVNHRLLRVFKFWVERICWLQTIVERSFCIDMLLHVKVMKLVCYVFCSCGAISDVGSGIIFHQLWWKWVLANLQEWSHLDSSLSFFDCTIVLSWVLDEIHIVVLDTLLGWLNRSWDHGGWWRGWVDSSFGIIVFGFWQLIALTWVEC